MAIENVGTIVYDAVINTKDFIKQAGQIEDTTEKLTSNTERSSGRFSAAWTGAIAGVAASITSKLISSVSSLTGEMAQMYDASVKFPKVLEVMGATTEESSQAFNDLKKYADDTIFSLKDMTETFGSLYGIVGKDSTKMVKALGGISSLASNSQQAMKSWSLQLTQMVSKPIVAWQDFRILLEQNPAAIAKIAESMGKTSKQLVKDVNDQKLSTEEFLKSLDKVGNSDALQQAATSSDNFGNSLGQLQAAVVSAGAQILEKFGPVLIKMINGAANAIPKLMEGFSKLGKLISPVSDAISGVYNILFKGDFKGGIFGLEEDSKAIGFLFDVREAAKGVYDILFKGDFSGGFLGLEEDSAVIDFLFTLRETVGQTVESIKKSFGGLDFAGPLSMRIELAKQIFTDFFSSLLDTWNTYGSSIVVGISQAIDNIVQVFGMIYERVILPFIVPFMEELKRIWDSTFKDLVSEGLNFIGKFIQFALQFYNGFIAPLNKFFLTILTPVFSGFGKLISGVLGTALETIGGVIKNIFKILSGLIDFLTGVFTGDWERAWNGIKNIFSGIFGGIGAVIKGSLNSVIDLINGVIAGVNKIKIPGTDGINIGYIPKLAEGGVVKARPGGILANIGEGGEDEVVIPLSKLDKMLESDMTGNGRNQTNNITNNIYTETDIETTVNQLTWKLNRV